jgi:DNA invertase Pin-like site-specific DNA recombinase
MRAICYIRVSSESQVVKGVSLEAQESKARAWAALHDIAPDDVLVFVDPGLSGGRADNRPALQEALAAVRKGDALVVYSLSRLTRSTRDAIELASVLDKKECQFVSLSEQIDTTSPVGRMIYRVFAALAELERDQISARTKMALQHKIAQHRKVGSKEPPYGWTLVSTKRHAEGPRTGKLIDDSLVPDLGEQTICMFIAALRAKGITLAGIRTRLNDNGFMARCGRPFSLQTISDIIERSATR